MTQKPWGLEWRSSTWFVTFVVGQGVLVDLLVYSLIIPGPFQRICPMNASIDRKHSVIPFRLQAVGYDEVPVKTGWLVAAFVSRPPSYEVSVAEPCTSRLASSPVNNNLSRFQRISAESTMQGPRLYRTLPRYGGIAGTR